MVLEIKHVFGHRDLSLEIDVTLMTFGILFNILYIILWIVLIFVTMSKFFKIFNQKSTLHCLKVGLNQ